MNAAARSVTIAAILAELDDSDVARVAAAHDAMAGRSRSEGLRRYHRETANAAREHLAERAADPLWLLAYPPPHDLPELDDDPT